MSAVRRGKEGEMEVSDTSRGENVMVLYPANDSADCSEHSTGMSGAEMRCEDVRAKTRGFGRVGKEEDHDAGRKTFSHGNLEFTVPREDEKIEKFGQRPVGLIIIAICLSSDWPCFFPPMLGVAFKPPQNSYDSAITQKGRLPSHRDMSCWQRLFHQIKAIYRLATRNYLAAGCFLLINHLSQAYCDSR